MKIKKLLAIGAFFPLVFGNAEIAKIQPDLGGISWGYIISHESPYTPILPLFLATSTSIFIPNEDERDVFSIINYFAVQNEVEIELALYLAEIESGFIAEAKNASSSAKGLYMFINSTWKHYCEGEILNPYWNAKCALEMIGRGEISHWLADINTKNKLLKKFPLL